MKAKLLSLDSIMLETTTSETALFPAGDTQNGPVPGGFFTGVGGTKRFIPVSDYHAIFSAVAEDSHEFKCRIQLKQLYSGYFSREVKDYMGFFMENLPGAAVVVDENYQLDHESVKRWVTL